MAALVAVLTLVLAAAPVHATNYNVGDNQGWGFSVNYTSWASGKTFAVGDTLLFVYDKTRHDVEEVRQSDYTSCSSSNVIRTDSTGNTTIALNAAGTRYFICGFPSHCSDGMKLAVTVSGSGSGSPTTPAPGGSTAPPPNSGSSASPPTSPSGGSSGQTPPSPSGGALSTGSYSMGALFSGVLLVCIALLC